MLGYSGPYPNAPLSPAQSIPTVHGLLLGEDTIFLANQLGNPPRGFVRDPTAENRQAISYPLLPLMSLRRSFRRLHVVLPFLNPAEHLVSHSDEPLCRPERPDARMAVLRWIS